MTPFQLVGVHWRGPGRVELRTRSTTGRWSPWKPVQEAAEDAPDSGSAERRTSRGWRVGAPVWVGRAVAVEVRTVGRVTRARALTVRSPVSRVPFRVVASPGVPRLVARAAWQADEAIVRGKPSYADALRMAHVHHTAGTNTYTRLQAPAVVRAIQLYHVKGNGWNDIGYNALVDRFGTVYEGRARRHRPQRGRRARARVQHRLVRHRGDGRLPHRGAAGRRGRRARADARLAPRPGARRPARDASTGSPSGNERFGVGIPVFLRAISGHRDTGLTTCPGERLYAQLGDIARRVAALGLPKLYAPLVAADEAGGIRFRARVSSALAWSVVVTDAAGIGARARRRAPGRPSTGRGGRRRPSLAGTRWRIETPGATSAEGTLGGDGDSAALQLTAATASPATISPNGDGQADTTTIAFTLTVDANVTVSVIDAAGAAVAELESRRWRRAGQRTVAFDGGGLPDGAYVVRVVGTGDRRAHGGRRRPRRDHPRDRAGRALGACADAERRRQRRQRLDRRPAHRPGDALRAHPPRRQVGRDTASRRPSVPASTSRPGTARSASGRPRDGTYTVAVEAVDGLGTARVELPLLVDATAPAVRVVSESPPRLRVSEAATLVLRVERRSADAAGRRGRASCGSRASSGSARSSGRPRDAAGNRTVVRR